MGSNKDIVIWPRRPGKATLVENLMLKTALRDLALRVGAMTIDCTCYFCGHQMEDDETGYVYEVQHEPDCPYPKAVALLESLGIKKLNDPVG